MPQPTTRRKTKAKMTGTITTKPNGRYLLRWRDETGQRGLTFRTLAEATTHQAKITAELAQGTYRHGRAGRMPFHVYAEGYLNQALTRPEPIKPRCTATR